MIRRGFLTERERQELRAIARSGLSDAREARRANAIVLLDRGWSCDRVAEALLLDDDTIRSWWKLYQERGQEGLFSFEGGGSLSRLSGEQEYRLKEWVEQTLARTTRAIGAFIESEFGVVYASRSGLIALLHRLGLEYRKPQTIPRKLDPDRQQAFIAAYEVLLNSLGTDEAVLFADAVHPTHAVRAVGCWAPAHMDLAIEQTSGRERVNIHGALDLETGTTRMIEVQTVDAASTIALLASIENHYPAMSAIHVFLDNARYHRARIVRQWLAEPGRRIVLHFIPPYCPHLNPIERLWALLMHRHLTHNKVYDARASFVDAVLDFLRDKVPKNWRKWCDAVSDNFRIINPRDFRILA